MLLQETSLFQVPWRALVAKSVKKGESGIVIDYKNLLIAPQQVGLVLPAVWILNQGVKGKHLSCSLAQADGYPLIHWPGAENPPTSTCVPKFVPSLFRITLATSASLSGMSRAIAASISSSAGDGDAIPRIVGDEASDQLAREFVNPCFQPGLEFGNRSIRSVGLRIEPSKALFTEP